MKKILLVVVCLLVAGIVAVVVLNSNGKHMEQAADKAAGSGPPADLYRTGDPPGVGGKHLSFSAQGPAVVLQNAETDIDMPVVRHSDYSALSSLMGNSTSPASLFLAGKFQGEVKLTVEIPKGCKGLTVKFDPEIVKGSDDRSKLRIIADAEADLGDVDIKITATASDGTKADVGLKIEIYKK